MWRIAVGALCVVLAGCVSNKKDTADRKALLPRADFILENNETFFAKPKDDVAPDKKP